MIVMSFPIKITLKVTVRKAILLRTVPGTPENYFNSRQIDVSYS
jgi:hypothetical protein